MTGVLARLLDVDGPIEQRTLSTPRQSSVLPGVHAAYLHMHEVTNDEENSRSKASGLAFFVRSLIASGSCGTSCSGLAWW